MNFTPSASPFPAQPQQGQQPPLQSQAGQPPLFPQGMDAETFERMRANNERHMQEMLFKSVMESCPGKTVASGVIGFGLGAAMGVFFSSVDWNMNTEEFHKLSTREQIKQTFKDMASKSYSSAKNFAIIGAVFSSSECVIESFRAKHDIYNPVLSGCFTGAAIAARAGPQAMLFGCGGFAAFSGAIDYVMHRFDN